MPDMGLDVDVKGFQELARRAGDADTVLVPLRGLFEGATQVGQRAAVVGVDGGTGVAVRSVNREVFPLQARVYTAMPVARAMNIERGRPPGQPVEDLLPQLIRWREAVGHPDPAIVIALEIRRRGVKGRFFMRAAKEAMVEVLPRLSAAAGREITSRLAGRR